MNHFFVVFPEHARDEGLHVIIECFVDSSDSYHACVALLSHFSAGFSDHMGGVSAYLKLLLLVEGKETGVVNYKLKGPLVRCSLGVGVCALIVVISLKLSSVDFDACQVTGSNALRQRDAVVVG